MHASWGDKSKGLTISERGAALGQTLSVICWTLEQLESNNSTGSAKLVKLWIDALADAAKAAGASATTATQSMSLVYSSKSEFIICFYSSSTEM